MANETWSGYMQYVPVILPNVPARTTFIELNRLNMPRYVHVPLNRLNIPRYMHVPRYMHIPLNRP